MNNSDDFFIKKMKGVTPLKKHNRENNQKTIPPKKNIKNNKNENTTPLKTELSKKIDKTHFGLEKISIKKSIKRGLFKIDKKIDFHGETLLSAENIFNQEIINCFQSGKRCLLFVTGKGVYSINKKDSTKPRLYHGVIRMAFGEWARSKKLSKYILSFEKASINHGGDGAFYVYLRKNKS